MSYEGQVLREPKTTRWVAFWRVESDDPDADAGRLSIEAEREGIELSIGKIAPLTEDYETMEQYGEGPWVPRTLKLIRRRGALMVGCVSTHTQSTVLVRQHSLFKTWLAPATQTYDSTERDWQKLHQAWARAGLPEPVISGRPTPVFANAIADEGSNRE